MKNVLFVFMILGIVLSANASETYKRRHFCRPDSTTISCQLELALVCGPGYVDGCLVNQTQTHRCVRVNEGPLCEQEVAILCPAGFRDGCEIGQTTHHQCVPVKGSACKSAEPFSCPEGFSDDCEM